MAFKFFKKTEPQPIEVAGKELACQHCQNRLFWVRNAQLNTSLATFFGFDWANRTVTCFVCSECTHISWFLGR